MELFSGFVHLVFVGFVALFPPVNPIGSALIAEPFFNGVSLEKRKEYAKKIAFYSASLCILSTLLGSWIFNFFGISLPVVQFAGGFLICQMGFKLLSNDDTSKSQYTQSGSSDSAKIEDILFYPIAFPVTTGAGTIAVLLTLSAHINTSNYLDYFVNLSAVFTSVILMCFGIYFCYAYTPKLLSRIGERGEKVMNSLSAFIVFCVGLQIGITGLLKLIH